MVLSFWRYTLFQASKLFQSFQQSFFFLIKKNLIGFKPILPLLMFWCFTIFDTLSLRLFSSLWNGDNNICLQWWVEGLKWKWKLLSRVWLLVHGILQAKILEYCFPSPGDLPNPGIKPRSPTLQADSLPAEPQGKPKNTRVGSLSLLQGIFLTQESNRGLLHCRQIPYQLSYQGSPRKTGCAVLYKSSFTVWDT